MSVVTILSNQNYVVSAKLAESAKSPGDDSAYMLTQHICCVSNNVSLSRSTTYFVTTLADCLSCVDFDRHLVSVSSSGAHFNCCAYIIDLTQHWIFQYTFWLASKRFRYWDMSGYSSSVWIWQQNESVSVNKKGAFVAIFWFEIAIVKVVHY